MLQQPRIFRQSAGSWRTMTALALLLSALTSMTGCVSPSVVVVPGGETVTVPKQTLDNLYADNEALLKALQECRSK